MTRLVLDDRFDAPVLDPDRWVPHYLPQWSTPELTAARYDLGEDGLRLRVDADQPAWHPDEPGVRVSSIQTATFSGPAGSERGSHRHRPGGIAVFAICADCGDVTEFQDESVKGLLETRATELSFRMDHTTIELHGKCRACTEEDGE